MAAMNADPALISNWIIFIVGGAITFVGTIIGAYFAMKIAIIRLQTEFDAACQRYDEVRTAVFGNGHDGLVKLVDRHEQILKGWTPSKGMGD